MVDEIGTDGIVSLQFGGYEELRADAVGRCDERSPVVSGQAKDAAKAPDRVELIGMPPRAKHVAIAGHRSAPCGDIDAGARICVGSATFLGRARGFAGL